MVRDIIPSENVEYSDIRDSLNASGGTVNNDVSSAFKESANVNKWAKYKPEDINKQFDITLQDRINNGYGIDCKGFVNKVSFLFDAFDFTQQFKYVLPTGGSSSPFRIGDFRNYSRNAKSPFTINNPTIGYGSYITSIARSSIDTNYNLTLEDLKFVGTNNVNIADMYFGIAYKNTSGTIGWKTYEQTMGDLNGKYPLMEIPLSNGYYECRWFLSSEPSTTTEEQSLFIPLQEGGFTIESLKKTALSGMIVQNEGSLGTNFEYTLEVYNQSTSDVTLTNCYIYEVYEGTDITGNITAPEKKISLGSIPISAGSSTRKSDSVINLLDTSRNIKIYFRCDQTSWNEEDYVSVPK